MNHQQLQLADLARLVQGECVGQADLRLSALASLEHATSQDLAFVNADKYVEQANQSQAAALIVTAELKQQITSHQNFIVVANPYLAFAILTHVFEKKIPSVVSKVLLKFILQRSSPMMRILDTMW